MNAQLFILLLFCASITFAQNVSINNSGAAPDASAMLDVQSTDKGMFTPRMTTAQREAISAPANGLVVYDTDTNTFWFFRNSAWQQLLSSVTTFPIPDPVEIGVYEANAASTRYDIALQDDYAYLIDNASDSLKIIQVGNPEFPAFVGGINIDSSQALVAVAVQGNYAYVVEHSTTNDLKVIDVSNPALPSLVGSLVLTGKPYEVAVQGDYVYIVSTTSADLKIIDVSNPSLPAVVGSLVLGTNPFQLALQGDYAYALDSETNDLKIIDVSNPAAPSLAGSLVLANVPSEIAVLGNSAFVLDNTDMLNVIDVTNPAAPFFQKSIEINGDMGKGLSSLRTLQCRAITPIHLVLISDHLN